MGFVGGIWLFLLGVLGASGLIISRKPEAKELIDKLVPYQGWMGFVSVWWGFWMIITSLRWMGLLSKGYALTFLAIGIVQLLLGAILGVGVAKTFVKNKDAQKKITQVVSKLVPFQGTLGLIAIFLGIWGILANIILL